MAIKLFYCLVCKKYKSRAKPAEISNKEGKILRGYICISCLNSGEEVIRIIKKLKQTEKDKVIDYVINKLMKFK